LAALPFTDPFHPNIIWILVAAQFALFSLPGFLALESDRRGGLTLPAAARLGWTMTRSLLGSLWRRRDARRFLVAYLCYEDGVNTVIVFSSVFAATTLGFGVRELVFLYILVQFSALLGAWAMAGPTDRQGPKFVVVVSLLLWCAV